MARSIYLQSVRLYPCPNTSLCWTSWTWPAPKWMIDQCGPTGAFCVGISAPQACQMIRIHSSSFVVHSSCPPAFVGDSGIGSKLLLEPIDTAHEGIHCKIGRGSSKGEAQLAILSYRLSFWPSDKQKKKKKAENVSVAGVEVWRIQNQGDPKFGKGKFPHAGSGFWH
jgi:hypothetical protein